MHVYTILLLLGPVCMSGPQDTLMSGWSQRLEARMRPFTSRIRHGVYKTQEFLLHNKLLDFISCI